MLSFIGMESSYGKGKMKFGKSIWLLPIPPRFYALRFLPAYLCRKNKFRDNSLTL